MPRKGHTQKRDVLADPIYNNKVVTKLINNIMLDGKKGVAQKIVYGAFERVAEKSGKDAVEVFEEAMNNIMPVLEVKAKRIGGATYQVPIEVKPERRQALALGSRKPIQKVHIVTAFCKQHRGRVLFSAPVASDVAVAEMPPGDMLVVLDEFDLSQHSAVYYLLYPAIVVSITENVAH